MHLRILPDHQKLFIKKDFFYRLEWVKTCLHPEYMVKQTVLTACDDAHAAPQKAPAEAKA
jgi:hypothetical protein